MSRDGNSYSWVLSTLQFMVLLKLISWLLELLLFLVKMSNSWLILASFWLLLILYLLLLNYFEDCCNCYSIIWRRIFLKVLCNCSRRIFLWNYSLFCWNGWLSCILCYIIYWFVFDDYLRQKIMKNNNNL